MAKVKKTCMGCSALRMNGFPEFPDLMPKCDRGFSVRVSFNGTYVTVSPKDICTRPGVKE